MLVVIPASLLSLAAATPQPRAWPSASLFTTSPFTSRSRCLALHAPRRPAPALRTTRSPALSIIRRSAQRRTRHS